MRNKLILITNNFPFGNGESFLEAEIKYLADAFEHITIISNNTTSEQTRVYPSNIEVVRLGYNLTFKEKLNSLFLLFNRSIWKELANVRHLYQLRINAGILFTLLTSWYKHKKVNKVIDSVIKGSNNNDRYFLYTYWANDMAISIATYENDLILKRICRAHHGDVYFNRSVYNYLPFRDFLFRKLDHVCFISENSKKYTIEKLKNNYISFEITRLGIDNPHMPKSKNFSKNVFHIVSCSFLKPVKRVHLIIEALSLISRELKIKWEHFGGGELEEEFKQKGMQLMANKKNIDIEFRGYISNQELLKQYEKNDIDLFLNVSASEGVPVSIMEALSFGIPVLATDVGANSEIVSNNHGKLLDKNISSIELAKELTSYFNLEKAEKERLSKNAYEFWKTNYNASVNYPKFIRSFLS